MRILGLLVVSLLLPLGSAQAQGTWEHPRIERLAEPDLQTFESEGEYRRWVREWRRALRYLRGTDRVSLDNEIYVGAFTVERQEQCNPLFEDCAPEEVEEAGDANIVVTASRRASSMQSAPLSVMATTDESITNNQTGGVDEGDIVKRMGDYLLILQDGRIFVANFRSMELTDRVDVYRRDEDGEPIGADWYDEMLVQGDHIIVTAYSYYDDASELSVFRLNRETGRVERRGVFLISSEDYYDVDNYATRVIDDQLVIYTPYEPEDLVSRRDRPVVRRWVPSEEFDEPRGDAMLNARDIYRPVFGVFEPVVHTISICDLGDLDEDTLECDSTGFIAGENAEMFVSRDNIYLATTAASWNDMSGWRTCRARNAGFEGADGPPPGAVFRIPMGRPENVDMLPVRGLVFDQFSMDEQGSRFRMLTNWQTTECGENWWQNTTTRGPIELVDTTIAAFGTRFRDAPESRFDTLPAVMGRNFENRFVGEWLLYGTRSRYGRPPILDDGETIENGFLMAVPLGDVERTTRLDLGHEVTRIESLGIDAIVTGYRDESGLSISYVDLADVASIADTAFLEDRYESESRSHAFNATIYPEMDGLMGLPTVRSEDGSGRWWWRSEESGISFLRFSDTGQLTSLSDVQPGEGSDEVAESYDCEVSCIDWYGNTRPIFIERGVYALMGTELVEARAGEETVEVLRRLDLTGDLRR